MPNDKDVAGVDLEQYQNEKNEFNSDVEDILAADDDKTDEEIIKEMDDKKVAGKKDEGGIPKEDPPEPTPVVPNPDDSASPTDDPDKKPDTKPVEDPPAGTETNWQEKAESLEAELAKEKQKTSSWNGRITAANEKVKTLEAEVESLKIELQVKKTADSKADDASAKSDADVLNGFRKDFPEMGDVIDVLQRRIDDKAPAKVPEPAKPKAGDDGGDNPPATDDPAKIEQANANKKHMDEIHEVHPDLSEAVNSGVLLTWINSQPDFIKPHLLTIYRKGSPSDVVKMVTEFKDKTGWKSQLAVDSKEQTKQEKLNSMAEVKSESGGAPPGAPDKNDYEAAAKEAFAEPKK